LNSCLYEGRVRHRRFAPVEHAFTYTLFMMYLDLNELPEVFKDRWLWSTERCAPARFRRADHLGDPAVPLDAAVRARVQRETEARPAGPIRLLTHLRYFGYGFNPVSFYYCFDESDARVEYLVAEINNTPWGEQHCYVLSALDNLGDAHRQRYRFDKSFHVSPFMPMDLGYDWRFTVPRANLAVHMENTRNGEKLFDATLALQRREICTASLARALAVYPLMTTKVIAAIYWQALRLWTRQAPFHTHPDKEAPRPAKHS
jgi:DUF1365 family protein